MSRILVARRRLLDCSSTGSVHSTGFLFILISCMGDNGEPILEPLKRETKCRASPQRHRLTAFCCPTQVVPVTQNLSSFFSSDTHLSSLHQKPAGLLCVARRFAAAVAAAYGVWLLCIEHSIQSRFPYTIRLLQLLLCLLLLLLLAVLSLLVLCVYERTVYIDIYIHTWYYCNTSYVLILWCLHIYSSCYGNVLVCGVCSTTKKSATRNLRSFLTAARSPSSLGRPQL